MISEPDDAGTDDPGEITFDPSVYTEEELNMMTKDRLLGIAQTMGLDGVSSSMTKAQIIEAILANSGGKG